VTDRQAEEEAAVAAAGLVYFLRCRDPGYRMDRLLRRCEARIDDVETSVAQLEQSLSDSLS